MIILNVSSEFISEVYKEFEGVHQILAFVRGSAHQYVTYRSKDCPISFQKNQSISMSNFIKIGAAH